MLETIQHQIHKTKMLNKTEYTSEETERRSIILSELGEYFNAGIAGFIDSNNRWDTYIGECGVFIRYPELYDLRREDPIVDTKNFCPRFLIGTCTGNCELPHKYPCYQFMAYGCTNLCPFAHTHVCKNYLNGTCDMTKCSEVHFDVEEYKEKIALMLRKCQAINPDPVKHPYGINYFCNNRARHGKCPGETTGKCHYVHKQFPCYLNLLGLCRYSEEDCPHAHIRSCKDWQITGTSKCTYGDKCFFLHLSIKDILVELKRQNPDAYKQYHMALEKIFKLDDKSHSLSLNTKS